MGVVRLGRVAMEKHRRWGRAPPTLRPLRCNVRPARPATPTPNPSPQGGGERAAALAFDDRRDQNSPLIKASSAWTPPSGGPVHLTETAVLGIAAAVAAEFDLLGRVIGPA